jgi:asparagine synthase (glutamine-hydrolysing)
MCGIAGVMFRDGREGPRAAAIAGRMRAALGHRGPDGGGVWSSNGRGPAVSLAHTRLAVIDLSEDARQPMAEGRLAVTYNGEVFNFEEVRRALGPQTAPWRSRSDTEVLLRAFAQWGDGTVERLDGMFAFAVWNEDGQRLTLARDRFGIKPLYYAAGDGWLVFASEVRALMASDLFDRRLRPTALWDYLGYQTTPTPDTLLDGVRMLPPGHVLTASPDGRFGSREYWNLLDAAETDALTPAVSQDDARRRTRELLSSAVQSHLVSDVPVGVFLSGGIDSSAIVSALASAGHRPKTYSVTFADAAFDEAVHAREVARAFGTEHTELRLEGSMLLDHLPAILEATDHPSGDGVNTWVVSSMVRQQGVKVVLSGLGGDEIFGGYPSFQRLPRLMPAMRMWRHSPRRLRRATAGLVREAGGGSVAVAKAASVVEGAGTLASAWTVTRQLQSEAERRRLLAPDGRPRDDACTDAYRDLLDLQFAVHREAPLWSRISYAETRAYMHDVLLRDTDQMSMAHGLEVRVPLLDHRLATYVTGLPDRVKRAGGRAKPLLVQSLERPLPPACVDRPKRGFTLPFDVWMRGPLRQFCADRLGPGGLDGRGLFAPGALAELWTRFQAGAPGVTWARVWSLVALEAWLARHEIRSPV